MLKEEFFENEIQTLETLIKARVIEVGNMVDLIPFKLGKFCICFPYKGDAWDTMIKCSSKDCNQEWYHFKCVQIRQIEAPAGSYYCPRCTQKNYSKLCLENELENDIESEGSGAGDSFAESESEPDE
jgi:hypothetical protein